MTTHYQDIAFTPAVKAEQEANGSRRAYARREVSASERDRLTADESAFIETSDSFYMATVTETGWPYVQHRGGPTGFVKVLDDRTLGIADFRGNRQYVSLGNLKRDNRAALFFMDYPRQARLKLFARVRTVDLSERTDLAGVLVNQSYKARIERALLFDIEAFDWNCSQHITPRYTVEQITPSVQKLQARIAALEAEIARLSAMA